RHARQCLRKKRRQVRTQENSRTFQALATSLQNSGSDALYFLKKFGAFYIQTEQTRSFNVSHGQFFADVSPELRRALGAAVIVAEDHSARLGPRPMPAS